MCIYRMSFSPFRLAPTCLAWGSCLGVRSFFCMAFFCDPKICSHANGIDPGKLTDLLPPYSLWGHDCFWLEMIGLQQAWVRSGRPKYTKPTNGQRSTIIFGRQTGFCEFRCETTYPCEYVQFWSRTVSVSELETRPFPIYSGRNEPRNSTWIFQVHFTSNKTLTISGYRWYCWLLFKQIYFAGFVVDFCFSPRKQMQKNWLWNSTGRAQDIVGQVSTGW